MVTTFWKIGLLIINTLPTSQYYIRVGTAMSWDDAQAHCQGLGSELAKITNEAENLAILAIRAPGDFTGVIKNN
jgi:hypothetical protein